LNPVPSDKSANEESRRSRHFQPFAIFSIALDILFRLFPYPTGIKQSRINTARFCNPSEILIFEPASEPK
jgi:hypothetical protein